MNNNKGFFTIIYNDLVRSGQIKPHALAVYANLKSRKGNNLSAFPSHATIARETCMSTSQVKKCIKQLEDLGLVVVKHRYLGPGKQTSNDYLIFDKSAQLGKVNRQPHRDYEEDSFAEESIRKSSTKSNKRSWRFLKAGSPATESQLSYIADLQEQTGGFDYIETYPELSELDNLDQVQANELIQHLYIQKEKDERFN